MQKTASDKFNEFVFSIDDTIEQLRLSSGLGEMGLDLSIESLDGLEAYLDDINIKISDVIIVNRAAQYLGECLRINYGGKWIISDDQNSSLTFNMPVIIGHNLAGNPFSPIEVVENFAVHRDRGLFKSAISAEFEDFDFGLKPE